MKNANPAGRRRIVVTGWPGARPEFVSHVLEKSAGEIECAVVLAIFFTAYEYTSSEPVTKLGYALWTAGRRCRKRMARLGFLRAEEPHDAYGQQQNKNTGRQLCQYEFHHILLSEVYGSNVGETFTESSPELI